MTSQTSPSSKNNQPNRIKKLPPLLVNQLAAGEVVMRPASVVKELMENAIDAGASEITIKITQGGMGRIEVCDNGCGIHPDDMVMAVTRFATSKIADVAHLQGISTLGFRGEALAATAAVSRLTVKSSCDESGIGRELTVAGILEDTPSLIPVVHPQGTTVTVKDLYFNVPARRGNLKSISTEFNHIETVVKELALVASDITISLWHNDKRRFHFEAVYPEAKRHDDYSSAAINTNITEASKAIMSRLQTILPSLNCKLGNSIDTMVQPINVALEGLTTQTDFNQACQISGLLLPQSNVSSSASLNLKLIYINGRLVKDKRIAQCLRESVASFQTSKSSIVIEDLGYVLFFQLPKSWLNLNVHPSKRCIKIQNLANITAHLKVKVRDGLNVWVKKQPYEQASEASIDRQVDISKDIKDSSDRQVATIALNKSNCNHSGDIDYTTTIRSETSDKSVGSSLQKSVSENAQRYAISHNEVLNNNQQRSSGSTGLFSVSHPIKNEEMISCLSIFNAKLESDNAKRLFNVIRSSEINEVLTNNDQALVLVQMDKKLLLISDSVLLNFLYDCYHALVSGVNEANSTDITQDEYSNLSSGEKLHYLNNMVVICLSGPLFDNIKKNLQNMAICSMSYEEVMIAMLQQS